MTETRSHTRDDLVNFVPGHSTFVGIDSDGCVFDTMEIKQKKCFHSRIVSHWELESVERFVRETAEFVNLYSQWRGQNRFIALLRMFDMLCERPEVVGAGVPVPELPDLRAIVDSGAPLGNPTIEAATAESGSEELESVLKWSKDVNNDIALVAKGIPPFKWARESLELLCLKSDVICVSQTPNEALEREWAEHGLVRYVSVIAGQELGTKAEHLQLATQGRYEPANVLMMGDAPGDQRAAEANQALFYPINPAHEEASWQRFHDEAYDRFLAGTYAGAYERGLKEEFQALLPSKPPW